MIPPGTSPTPCLYILLLVATVVLLTYHQVPPLLRVCSYSGFAHSVGYNHYRANIYSTKKMGIGIANSGMVCWLQMISGHNCSIEHIHVPHALHLHPAQR